MTEKEVLLVRKTALLQEKGRSKRKIVKELVSVCEELKQIEIEEELQLMLLRG